LQAVERALCQNFDIEAATGRAGKHPSYEAVSLALETVLQRIARFPGQEIPRGLITDLHGKVAELL
jgi:hypothetical protein